jgi:2-polyprenyl-3-methyl-5-hydroxy-6-metoxy-1,4-benzoquinol methylase
MSDLAQALLFSFKKQVFAWGELEMPYNLALLDGQMQLIQSLLLALGQKPPSTELDAWRKWIEVDLAAQGADLSCRWVFSYKPLGQPNGGLPAGFEIKFKLQPPPGNPLPYQGQTLAWGHVKMPALPSFIDEHIKQIDKILRALEQELSSTELAAWRQAIASRLPPWFQASANAYLIVNYEPLEPRLGLAGGVNLQINTEIKSLNTFYHQWTETREGALFGTHADAKVMHTAQSLGHIAGVSVLDAGAGTGRNSLALAQAGYPVDALELTQVLCDRLRETAMKKNLSLNVIEGDIFASHLALPLAPYKLIVLAEVIASHLRNPQQVRELISRLCKLLQPGGMLLFNTFVAIDEYEPPQQVRELAQFYWSYVMTRKELKSVLEGLPLTLIADESVHDYEKAHLPAEAWPPTSWFINWSTGRNVFPLKTIPPIELRWILLKYNCYIHRVG